MTGDLVVNAGGDVSQSGALEVSGTTSIIAQTAGTFAVNYDTMLNDESNDFRGAVTVIGQNMAIVDVNGVDLGRSALTGDLIVIAGGDVSQSGALEVSGMTIVTAKTVGASDTYYDITLDNNGNDFVGSVSVIGLNVKLVDREAIDLAGSTVYGTLNVSSDGEITDTGALTLTGSATFDAGFSHSITLDEANDFSSIEIVGGSHVTINDVNGVVLDASNVSGNLAVMAGGVVSQSGTLMVSGDLSVNAKTSGTSTVYYDILLDHGGNDFGGSVSVIGKNVTINDMNGVDLGRATVIGDLVVNAKGDVGQIGAIDVSGMTIVTANEAGDPGVYYDITFDNVANDFGGAVSVIGNDVTIVDMNGVDLGQSTVTGKLILDAAGDLTQSGALEVSGMTSLTAQTTGPQAVYYNITLDHVGNDFGLAVSVTGQDVTIVDLNGVDLGLSMVNGDLVVNAGGNVAQSGALEVLGMTIVTAKTAGTPDTYYDIALNNHFNDFDGSVSVKGLNVQLVDQSAIALGASTVNGTLNVTSAGAITDTGDLTVKAAATFEAGSVHSIVLDNANDFSSVGIIGGNNVTINDVGSVVLSASTVNGNLAVTAVGDVTQSGALVVSGNTSVTGASVTLTAPGNEFTGSVDLTGKTVSCSPSCSQVPAPAPSPAMPTASSLMFSESVFLQMLDVSIQTEQELTDSVEIWMYFLNSPTGSTSLIEFEESQDLMLSVVTEEAV